MPTEEDEICLYQRSDMLHANNKLFIQDDLILAEIVLGLRLCTCRHCRTFRCLPIHRQFRNITKLDG